MATRIHLGALAVCAALPLMAQQTWQVPPLPENIIRTVSLTPNAAGSPVLTVENTGSKAITALVVCISTPLPDYGHTISWDYFAHPYGPGDRWDFGPVFENSTAVNTYPCAAFLGDGTHIGKLPEEAGYDLLKAIAERRRGRAAGLAAWQERIAQLPADDAAAIAGLRQMVAKINRPERKTEKLKAPPDFFAMGYQEAANEPVTLLDNIDTVMQHFGYSAKAAREEFLRDGLAKSIAAARAAAEAR